MMQSIIDTVVQWATALIGDWGLPAVFLLMLLESACIPVPSEAIMPFAGFAVSEGTMTLLGITVAGVTGNVVGSWIAYWVGLYGGRPFIDKYGKYVLLRHHHVELAERWFAKYGPVAVFFSRCLPIVRTFISLPAGIARMPFWKFTLYTRAGLHPVGLLPRLAGHPARRALGGHPPVPALRGLRGGRGHRRGDRVGGAQVAQGPPGRRGTRRHGVRGRGMSVSRRTSAEDDAAGDAAGAGCRVRVPATTANIGPGFDCLGLALDLWNEVRFSLEGDGVVVTVEGPDPAGLPRDENNLVARAFLRLCEEAGRLRRPACASTATSACR